MIQLPTTARLISFFLVAVSLVGGGCSPREATVASLPLDEHALWITDDGTHMVYRVSIAEGAPVLRAAFESPARNISGISLDPTNGTLWGAEELRRLGRGRLVNFTQFGEEISSIRARSLDRDADTVEGVAFDRYDSSLWAVDDSTCKIYHFEDDGGLLDSFTCSTYDTSATSPQEIDVDPADGTLWLTDNITNAIYHLRRSGRLIASIGLDLIDPEIGNLQGIAIDAVDGSVWLTARDTARVYNVTSEGTLISSFSTTLLDPKAVNPTGIAVEADEYRQSSSRTPD